jgi:5-methylcytosine-specific restriction endonuclease McrA
MSGLINSGTRCTRTQDLEVHHKRRDGGGESIDNAEILCPKCHQATGSYGTPGTSPPRFSQDVKDRAMRRAGNRCECTRTGGCH